MKYLMFDIINSTTKPLDEIKQGLTKQGIEKVWTIYDEAEMWENNKFNPLTGKPVETLDDITPIHRKGVLLEDYIHDWNCSKTTFSIYSHFYSKDTPIKVLMELKQEER